MPTPTDVNERELVRELGRLDPRLAGLLEEALRLVVDPDRPGSSFLIAHAGRELSRGVVSILDELPIVKAQGPETAAQQEANRQRIARVLGLTSDDPRVTRWFQLVDLFSANNKYRDGVIDAAAVANAFREFSTILFGRIGPYFDAQSIVDELLTLDSPEEGDISRLRAVLGRPSLRRYFFQRLKAPGWLPVLYDKGLIGPASPARTDEQGRKSIVPWPEGAYLVRVADEHPALVCTILETVPDSLDNLAVWRNIAEATVRLPAPSAGRLASKLSSALRRHYGRFFAHACFPVVVHLASQAEEMAFRMTRDLLAMRKRPTEQRIDDERSPRPRFNLDSGPILEVLDDHDVERFFDDVVPAIIASNPTQAFETMRERLRYSITVSEPADPRSPRSISKRWCRDLEDPEHDDIRCRLAGAMLSSAVIMARNSEAEARWVLDELAAENHEVFERARLLILAEVAGSTADLLEAAVCTPVFLDAPWGDRESARLLRAQFANLSTRGRKLLLHSLQRGPDAAYLDSALSFRDIPEPTEAQIQSEVERWQRGRLLWFEGALPEELRGIAETLDALNLRPTFEELQLAYDDMYVGGGSWRGEPSPLSQDDLRNLSTANLVDYISRWEPADSEGPDSPTRRGLASALEGMVFDDPERGGGLAEEVLRRGIIDPKFLGPVLRGWRRALDGNNERVPWEAAISLVEAACRLLQTDMEGARARELASESIDLLEVASQSDHIPESASPRCWLALTAAHSAASTWAEERDDPPASFDNVLHRALNTLAGRLAAACMDLALWEYRWAVEKGAGGEEGKAAARLRITERIVPLIEATLRQRGPAAVGAQAALGRYLPQLWLLAPEWFLAARTLLLQGGVTAPLEHPLWGGYLTRGRYYSALFPVLRPWYMESATDLLVGDVDDDRSFSLMGHLITHLIIAVLRGDASLGEDGDLISTAFDRALVKHRTAAFWEIFRGWSDSEEAPPPDFIARLLAFWAWRLERLEVAAATDDRAKEASGLAWFIVTPHLPAAETLVLARRTLDLAKDQEHIPGVWPRLAELGESDLLAVLDIADQMVSQELARDFPYLPVDEVGPVLRLGLQSREAELQDRARRLVHLLGERCSDDYKSLLSSSD